MAQQPTADDVLSLFDESQPVWNITLGEVAVIRQELARLRQSEDHPKIDAPYTRLEDIAYEYAQSFDLDDYVPSAHERAVVQQAINGLICREDFMETIIAARALTHAARKEDGQHPCCGAGLEHPHYGLCVNAPSRSGSQT